MFTILNRLRGTRGFVAKIIWYGLMQDIVIFYLIFTM